MVEGCFCDPQEACKQQCIAGISVRTLAVCNKLDMNVGVTVSVFCRLLEKE